MLTATHSDLRFWIANEYAYDATHLSYAQANALRNSHYLEIVAVVPGFFNISGALLRDEKGTMYAITNGNAALLRLIQGGGNP